MESWDKFQRRNLDENFQRTDLAENFQQLDFSQNERVNPHINLNDRNFHREDLTGNQDNQVIPAQSRPRVHPENSVFFCNNYIGNSNLRWKEDNFSFDHSSKWSLSNTNIQESSTLFKSSADILVYLKEHPDFLKLPKDSLDAIFAAILSGIALAGGIALTILSSGSLSPILVITSNLLVSSGVLGLETSISGIIHQNFSWENFAVKQLKNAAVTLLTFGAGYQAGNWIGLAVKGVVTEKTAKILGIFAGALAGSATKGGTFVIINTATTNQFDALEVVLQAATGALDGAFAGFLGAKVAWTKVNKLPPPNNEIKKIGEQTIYHNSPQAQAANNTIQGSPGHTPISNYASTQPSDALHARAIDIAREIHESSGGPVNLTHFFEQPQTLAGDLGLYRPPIENLSGTIQPKVFLNRGDVLGTGPGFTFQEYDIQGPLQLVLGPNAQVANRGTYRLVRCLEDARIWYTSDHYRTFQRIYL